jgi:hypothetical protein
MKNDANKLQVRIEMTFNEVRCTITPVLAFVIDTGVISKMLWAT